MNYLYLIINILTVAIPLLYIGDKRLDMWPKKIVAFLMADFIVSLVFIVWDGWFTDIGIWGFNPNYITGIYLWHLPMEEWLFFICIPFACLMIHEALKYFLPNFVMKDSFRNIYLVLAIVCVLLLLNYSDRLYTAVTAVFTLVFSIVIWLRLSTKLVSRLFLSFLVVIIPFLLVNGLLTGTSIEDQVVWYNNEENMGIRVGTIPMDDFFYCFTLIGGIIVLYEYFLKKMGHKASIF